MSESRYDARFIAVIVPLQLAPLHLLVGGYPWLAIVALAFAMYFALTNPIFRAWGKIPAFNLLFWGLPLGAVIAFCIGYVDIHAGVILMTATLFIYIAWISYIVKRVRETGIQL